MTGPAGVDPVGTTTTGSTASGSHVTTGASEGRSLGEIVGDLSNDLTTLVKQEIELAKTEAKAEAAKAGKGIGLFGGAGVTGHLALIFLSLTLMFLLDSWMHTALAALIVAVLWLAAAGVMAMVGRKELKSMNPKLETTQKTLKEDAAWAKELKSS